MKKKKLLIGIGAAAIIVLIIGLNIYRNLQGNSVPVKVFAVRQEKIEETVLASGRVEALNREEITSRTGAMVQDVLVRESDTVKAGQVLLRLESDDLANNLKREEANLAVQKANLSKARAGSRPQQVEQDRAELKRSQAAYDSAKARYDRTQVLYKQGAVSKESLESAYTDMVSAESAYRTARERLSMSLEGDSRETVQALEAQVRQAKVAVELAGKELAQAEVKASMDGVVLVLEAEKGKYVNTGTLLVIVGEPTELQVKADVSEADSSNLAVGQPVTITCPALPDRQFSGKVARVGASAVTTTKSGGEQTDVEVTVRINDSGSELKPGYTVDLNITTASRPKAVVIPHDAVLEKRGIKEVFTVEDGKAVKRRIWTGIGNELYISVEKGLKKGDKVVVNPPDKLTGGALVSESEYEAAAAANSK